DARAFAGTRPDLEVVRQPPGTAEAEAEAVARRVAVAERDLDVRNARAAVFEHEPEAASAIVVQRLEADRPAAPVEDGVPRQLARRGHELRLVDEAEARRDRPLADDLADGDDVFRRANDARLMLEDGHSRPPPPCVPARSAASPSRRSARWRPREARGRAPPA